MQFYIFFINFVYFFMKSPYSGMFLLFFCRFFVDILCTLHNPKETRFFFLCFNFNILKDIFATNYPKTSRRMEEFLKMRYINCYIHKFCLWMLLHLPDALRLAHVLIILSERNLINYEHPTNKRSLQKPTKLWKPEYYNLWLGKK